MEEREFLQQQVQGLITENKSLVQQNNELLDRLDQANDYVKRRKAIDALAKDGQSEQVVAQYEKTVEEQQQSIAQIEKENAELQKAIKQSRAENNDLTEKCMALQHQLV